MDLEFLASTMTVFARATGIVFAYAVFAKLKSIGAFIDELRRYKFVPDSLVPTAALLILALESMIAIAHLAILSLSVIAPFTALLLIAFLAFSVRSVVRGETRKCLCFGANQDHQVDALTIARISLLLLIEGALIVFVFVHTDTSPWPDQDIADIATSLVAAISLVLLAGWCLIVPEIVSWWRLRPAGKLRKSLLSARTDPMWQFQRL